MRFLLMMLMVLLMASFGNAQKFKYVGVKKCKTCHKAAKYGNQMGVWSKSKHAKAFATLASPEAKKIAKEKGIADPQKAPECLKCHVTAFSAPTAQKMKTLTQEEGVSCESCHGPGSAYKKMSVMKKITAGKVKGTEFGLVMPDEKTCVTCHNPESPTYKKFVFAEQVKKIAHPLPKK